MAGDCRTKSVLYNALRREDYYRRWAHAQCMCVRAYVCMCMCVYLHICMHVCVYIYGGKFTLIWAYERYVCVCVYLYTYAYVYICVCVHIQTPPFTCKYIYQCTVCRVILRRYCWRGRMRETKCHQEGTYKGNEIRTNLHDLLSSWYLDDSIYKTICRRDQSSSDTLTIQFVIEGGEDAQDALKCSCISANEPLVTGLCCGKWPIKINWYSDDTVRDRGWRRCIGCLKLQLYLRKWATSYRALLWKIIWKDNVILRRYVRVSSESHLSHTPAKQPLCTGLFCGKWAKKIRYCRAIRRSIIRVSSESYAGKIAIVYRALLRKMT